jgi:hypothetical protein
MIVFINVFHVDPVRRAAFVKGRCNGETVKAGGGAFIL